MAKTKQEKKVDYIKLCITEAERYRQNEVGKDFPTYYDLYKGRHWKGQDITSIYNADYKPVTNYIFSLIRTSIALLTDSNPRLTALPTDRSDVVGADLIRKIIWMVWDKAKCKEKLTKVLLDSHIFGSGFWKIGWDGKDITIDVIPPEYLFVSPDATSVYDASYIFQKVSMSLSQIRRKYPKYKGELKADESLTGSDVLKRYASSSPSGNSGVNAFKDTTGAMTTVYPADDKNELIEGLGVAWVVEWMEYDHEKKDYLITVLVGDAIVDEFYGKEIFGESGVMPYVQEQNYMESNYFWGMSEVALLAPLQRDLDRLKDIVYNHIRKSTNTPWINDANSGVDVDKVTDDESIIITKNPGTEFRRDPPPPLPNDIFKAIADIKVEMDTIAGIHDVTQGRRPVGITAGVAISELQEAGQVPVRFKGRIMQEFLNQVGKIILLIVQKKYTKAKLLPIVRDMNPDIKDFDPSRIQGEADIYFDVESGLRQSRAAKFNEAVQLFTLKLLDNRAVLEATDYPEREEIMKRMGIADTIQKMMATGMVPGLENMTTSSASGEITRPDTAGMPMDSGVSAGMGMGAGV